MILKKKKFKAAVIGCGRIGAEERKCDPRIKPITHASVWSGNPNTELVALVDIDEKKLRGASRHFSAARLYLDAREMFAQEKPDIVSVATPSNLHRPFVIMAAEAGVKAILCEKPIALSIAAAEEMIKICRERKVLLFVNHQRHFDPILAKWAARVRKGLLGDLLQGQADYYNGLMNSGTHLIDLIISFVGILPETVSARWNDRTTKDPEDRNADGFLKFPGGLMIAFQSVTPNYGLFGLRLIGDQGALEVTHIGFTVEYRKKIKNQVFDGFFQLSDKLIREGKLRSLYRAVGTHVVSCLKGKIKPRGTGVDALRVLKILMSIKQSADRRGVAVKILA